MVIKEKQKVDKARISVIMPQKACEEVKEKMLMEGYNLREKSRWYSEAIETFIKKANFQNFVEMATLMAEFSYPENLYISEKLNDDLEKAIIKVRKKYPALEGVKSLIVRASVIQRLLSRVNTKDVL